MKKFEYKALTVKKGVFSSGEKFAEQFTAELNAHGAEGWELVEISGNVSLEGYIILVFKREISF